MPIDFGHKACFVWGSFIVWGLVFPQGRRFWKAKIYYVWKCFSCFLTLLCCVLGKLDVFLVCLQMCCNFFFCFYFPENAENSYGELFFGKIFLKQLTFQKTPKRCILSVPLFQETANQNIFAWKCFCCFFLDLLFLESTRGLSFSAKIFVGNEVSKI